jgi:L-seryl-tRNA(Ser) seleniumtransferase
MTNDDDPRRRIPSVGKLFESETLKTQIASRGRALVERAVHFELSVLRDLASGDPAAFSAAAESIESRIVARIRTMADLSLRRVINATGVVVHTNLGRAPLSRDVAEHVASIASSYSNLEFDLDRGERGHREAHAELRLREMLGAGGSVVVNNNAAAVLLVVNTFAEGREVLVSRGELVEIGGSFRIPDVLRKGGATLVEVGTTNRTRVSDFAKAITPRTGLILRVHPSNFRIVGFTESASVGDLAKLAHERGITVAEDLGSGLLNPMTGPLEHEATIAASLQAGMDVVTASGDKLLGGPQAGLAIGARGAIDALRSNPLYRALRVDKMTIAALDAVLARHDESRERELPVPRMLAMPLDEIEARVGRLRDALLRRDLEASIAARPVDSAAGGGAAPDVGLPSCALSVKPANMTTAELARRLRQAAPPVIGRIEDDAVLFDLRTVLLHEDHEVEQILLSILGTQSR